MIMIKRAAFAAAAALALSACAHNNWSPPTGMTTADLEPAKARCVAMEKQSEDAATGATIFLLFGGLGLEARKQQGFDDCMRANGWTIAE
jgi:hypothetical protein